MKSHQSEKKKVEREMGRPPVVWGDEDVGGGVAEGSVESELSTLL